MNALPVSSFTVTSATTRASVFTSSAPCASAVSAAWSAAQTSFATEALDEYAFASAQTSSYGLVVGGIAVMTTVSRYSVTPPSLSRIWPPTERVPAVGAEHDAEADEPNAP